MRISDWSSDVCSSDLLRPRARYLRAQPLHLPRADHTGLVDDKNIARSQRIGAPRPAIFETGERPRRDARTALQKTAEHTSELQSLMRISYAVFCLKKQNTAYTSHPPLLHITHNSSSHQTQHLLPHTP